MTACDAAAICLPLASPAGDFLCPEGAGVVILMHCRNIRISSFIAERFTGFPSARTRISSFIADSLTGFLFASKRRRISSFIGSSFYRLSRASEVQLTGQYAKERSSFFIADRLAAFLPPCGVRRGSASSSCGLLNLSIGVPLAVYLGRLRRLRYTGFIAQKPRLLSSSVREFSRGSRYPKRRSFFLL